MRSSIAIVCLIACSSDRPPPLADGGGGADAGSMPGDPAPPAPPLAPVLGPCPAGWNETPASEMLDTPVCDPWPDTPLECPGLTTQFLATADCVAIGTACPAGDYAMPPPGVTPLYLRAGTSGDGSMARPFGSLTEAIANAPAGAVVLIAAGDYRGPITTVRAITLIGACPERTRLVADTTEFIHATSGELTLRNLHVAFTRGTMLIENGASLVLDAVVTTGQTASMVGGIGAVTIRDSYVRSDAPDSGTGIGVLAEGPVTVEHSVLRGFPEAGIVVYGARGVLTVEDSVVGGRFEGKVYSGGRSIQVTEGAMATIERTSLDLPGDAGFYAEGATAVLRDVLVEELRSRGVLAAAVIARGGASVTVERLWVIVPNGSAFRVIDPSTELVVRDAVVSEAWGAELGSAFGAEVSSMAAIELERVIIDGAEVAGIAITDMSSARLRDVSVRRTFGSSVDGDGGFGLALLDGSTLDAERIDLDANRHAGLVIIEGSMATIADLRVAATEPSAMYGTQGHGAYYATGAGATIERALFEQNHEIGISVFDPMTDVRFTDLRVATTRALSCTAPGCVAPEIGGIGVGAYGGAHLAIERFAIAEHALAGVQIAFGSPGGMKMYANAGVIDLSHGSIARNPIGVNVQDPAFDLDRLFIDVAFAENDRNVDAANLGIPRPPSLDF